MECPFELPVKAIHLYTGAFGPQYRFEHGQYGNKLFSISISKEQADYIVQAINSHEKLVDVCRNALTSLAITKLPRLDDGVASDNDIIKIVISSLQQALEADKKE